MAERPLLETDREAIISRYDIESGDFCVLEDITNFARDLCGANSASVRLSDEKRHNLIADVENEEAYASQNRFFCSYAMEGDDVFVVLDATKDGRFSHHELVSGPPFLRFYIGMPLIAADGSVLGVLCAMDDKPHNEVTSLQREGMRLLSRQILLELEGRRRDQAIIAKQRRDAETSAENERMFRTVVDAMPQIAWSSQPNGRHDYFNARWFEFTGLSSDDQMWDAWEELIHPDDVDMAWKKWQNSLEVGDFHEVEYRLRHRSGEYRWILSRASPLRDADGQIFRWIGTCTDIHDQHQITEERELIAHELSHRIKNIFSVVAGLIGLTAREYPEFGEVADDLRSRIMALGRAHDFVRPFHPNAPSIEQKNSLAGILNQIFLPYHGITGARIRLTGENPEIDDRSATPLALLFHELATNAVKYGALSSAEGLVTLNVVRDVDDYRFDWIESGGPMVNPESLPGFGSQVISLSIERQLGGRVSYNWQPRGLALSLWIPSRSMNRVNVKMA